MNRGTAAALLQLRAFEIHDRLWRTSLYVQLDKHLVAGHDFGKASGKMSRIDKRPRKGNISDGMIGQARVKQVAPGGS